MNPAGKPCGVFAFGDTNMSCARNPDTGRRLCDEARERLTAEAKLTAARLAGGDVSGAASAAASAVKTAMSGAAMMARNAMGIKPGEEYTQVGPRIFKVGSGNRRGDDKR